MFSSWPPERVERVQQAGEDNLATTVVSEIEILQRRHAFLLKASDHEQPLRAQELLDRSKELLTRIRIVPVDVAAAAEFIKRLDNKKAKKIGRADLLIASVALARRDVVVTCNTRHFGQVPGLRVENWAD